MTFSMIFGCNKKTTTKKETTVLKNTKLFSDITLPEEILVNETNIFSINEVEEGTIKKNYNPYKSSSIEVDVNIISPSNKEYFRPAYFTQDYDIYLNPLGSSDSYTYSDEYKGTDSATKTGIEHFNFSYKPFETGTHKYEIEVYTNNILVETLSGEFNVIDSEREYKGKIVVNDTNERYFMYENTKETYIPVGLNTGWYSSKNRKSYDYDEWFKRMENEGINCTRIWMASWSFGLHIGTGSAVDDFSKRLNQAARLERVLKLAEDKGIYLYLNLINHGQFSTNTNPEWDINPYNELISKPYLFFTTVSVKEIYKDELRYIVGRYGTYDSIMAYELFNEVDWTDQSSLLKNNITAWHKEMAKYINEIDCYDRLITTSYIYETGDSYSLDEIDIANIHSYDFTNGNVFKKTEEKINYSYSLYKKIVMFSEWGVNADTGEKTYNVDPKGITLYQSMWASVLTGGAGTTMCWWWDSYIHKYKLYDLYTGIAKITKTYDLSGEIKYLHTSDFSVTNGLDLIGIKANSNYYLYVYDSGYSRFNTTVNSFNATINRTIDNGIYTVNIYNPRTGDLLETKEVNIVNGTLVLENLNFNTEVAINIIKK